MFLDWGSEGVNGVGDISFPIEAPKAAALENEKKGELVAAGSTADPPKTSGRQRIREIRHEEKKSEMLYLTLTHEAPPKPPQEPKADVPKKVRKKNAKKEKAMEEEALPLDPSAQALLAEGFGYEIEEGPKGPMQVC